MSRTTKWVLVLGIFAILFVAVGVAVALSMGRGVRVPQRSVLWVKLGPGIPEEDRRSAVEKALGGRILTVRDHLRAIDAAASDRRIVACVVEPQFLGGGWATSQELRSALERFRDSGKPLVAFLEFGGNRDFYVASVADRVVMLPTGILMANGLMADVPFYKGTLAKIGIQADLEHIGAYKSASDLYTRDRMSDAQREATNAILDGLWDAYVSGVAKARSLDPARVTAAFDEGFLSAGRARELGLIDDLRYRDEVLDDLEARLGSRPETIKQATYVGSLPHPRSAAKIGLVYVTGTIVSGESWTDPFGGEFAGSETVGDALQKVREDSSIRAVILRVDSPGGSGLASDAIWREVELTRKEKPVIASMSDVAASGGYYVTAGADAIVAQPGTLTGSIGVISGKFSFRGLYDWAALRREQIKRGRNADLFSDYQGFTEEQRGLVRRQMEEFYRDFVQKVAAGRNRSEAEVEAAAQGRVWTGTQALDRGLVDEIGGLDVAVEIARERAGIPEGKRVVLEPFPKPKGMFESLFDWGGEESRLGAALQRALPRGFREMLARWRLEETLSAEPYLYLDDTLTAVGR